MSDFLFEDFQPITSKQWKQNIQVELNGLDYNTTVLSNTNEGITIKPFYHQDAFKKLNILPNKTDFRICQSIFVHSEKSANGIAKKAIHSGANSIEFIANNPFDYKVLLQDIFNGLSKPVVIHFKFNFLEPLFFKEIITFSKDQSVFLHVDIIENLVKNGNWFYSKQKDFEQLNSLLFHTNRNISIIGVDASIYQNAGANIVQQVAYALAHANEYVYAISQLVALKKIQNIEFEHLVKNISFKFAIGGNYFFEMAKLRAFRYVFNIILQKYNLQADINIVAQPSLRNKTLYDYNMNMLRTSTECMSAILGGANTISNVSYDAIFHKKNEFGERIARNQLLLLQEESHIKNSNPTAGSYYLEELTYEIADKALAIFKDIEKKGGFLNQLFEGTIQRKIQENAKKEQQQFDDAELILVGTNKYNNETDVMKNNLELYPFIKKKSGQTILSPLIAKRLAEKLEEQRLKKEK